jgi:hypothetical protein
MEILYNGESMLTTEQIESKFNILDIKIKGLTIQLERMNNDLSNKTNLTDLSRSINELKELIRTNAVVVQKIEEKLSKVILPEQTRFFLNEGEVENFQSNFNTLKAMMTKFDKLYRNLVAYQSNLKT